MRQKLNEKLILYSNGAKYGQVAIIVGGAGSGKSFAVDKFIGSENYKVVNVDDLKIQLTQLDKIKRVDIKKLFDSKFEVLDSESRKKFIELMDKYPNIKFSKLDFANPEHVMLLHFSVEMLGWKYKKFNLLVNDKKYLPNLLFDITGAKFESVKRTISDLKKAGYSPNNIHLTWVLNNYKVDIENNLQRSRVIPSDILLATHLGASQSMYDVIMDKSDIGINGRIDVILNNPENTVFYIDPSTKEKVGAIKDFIYLPVKKEGGSWYSEKVWKEKLYRMIMNNTPIMKTLEELLSEI